MLAADFVWEDTSAVARFFYTESPCLEGAAGGVVRLRVGERVVILRLRQGEMSYVRCQMG